jgi:hypothetical protein
VLGVALPEPGVRLCDLALELVDQSERGGDVASLGLGNIEPGEQLAPLEAKEI